MTEAAVSIISGLLTLIGVCVTAWFGNRRTAMEVSSKLDVAQAVTDARLADLTREVREHNSFARRIELGRQCSWDSRVAQMERELHALDIL